MKKISIIVPVYNEQNNIIPFYNAFLSIWQKIQKLNQDIEELDYEILFINDGSKDDDTEHQISDIISKDNNVSMVQFSKNFGKEIAVVAGFDFCSGDAAIVLDVDLQYPMEKIQEFVKKWQEGNLLVIGKRTGCRKVSMFTKLTSDFFYFIINLISDTKVLKNTSDFRLLDRVVIEEFKKIRDKNRINKTLIDWLGFGPVYVNYKENDRKIGTANYSFLKRVNLAISTLVSHSFVPLRLISIFGFLIMIFSSLFGLYMFYDRLFGKHSFSGNEILAVMNVFLTGMVLVSLGLMSFYIASIKDEVRKRPMYIIQKKINL